MSVIADSIDIPECTPAFLDLNTSKFTLQVIGLCITQFSPPGIIFQLWKIVPFNSEHILTPFGYYTNSYTQEFLAFPITWSVLKLTSVLHDSMVEIL